MQEDEYVVLKKSGMWPSKKTNGHCFTLVARHMKTHKSYKAWPDTTFDSSYDYWDSLKVGDIFTDVSIFKNDILTTTNRPRKVGKIEIKDVKLPEQSKLL